MKIAATILLILLSFRSFAQHVNVNFHIFESDKQSITPAMVCITNLDESSIVNFSEPTYPQPFFDGIKFSSDRNWIGPVRKTSGKGAVNGQRTYVYADNPSLPYWHEPVFYQVSGDFSLKLKPGKYRISIEHGNEYLPISEQFTVKPTDVELQNSYLLKRWIDLPARGWYSGDVHTHHASHKPEFNEYMMQFAKAEDVHVVNILEMGDRWNTYFKSSSYGAKSAICRENTCLIFGQEEPRSDYGHVIGLNTENLARDTANYNYYDIIFDKIHKAPEALAGFAHFAYRGEGVVEGMALYAPTQKINFIELLQNTQLNKEDYYEYLNLGFRISATAGSDFPWGSTIGDGRTFVYTGKNFSHYAWFEGLKKGNSFVSNGPAVFLEVNGNIPGSELNIITGEKATISVKSISNDKIGRIKSIEIYNNDGLLASQPNDSGADSVSINLIHTITKSQWVCAVVYCSNSAVAHTSPVYILADGKPIFERGKAPAIINKLNTILDKVIAAELRKPSPGEGIITRARKAQSYYAQLPPEN